MAVKYRILLGNCHQLDNKYMTTVKKMLLIGMFFFLGCSKEQTSEPTNDDLAGYYVSNTFTLPDAADRSIDVQAAGGFIQMTLTEKNEYSSTVNIPQSVPTVIGSGITKTYSGVFSLANDTIKLDSSGFIISAMKWSEGNNSLESISPVRGAISFVLQKK
jgi:hypothetical protein